MANNNVPEGVLGATKYANSPVPVIKGNLQQLFRPIPIDTTVVRSKYLPYGQSTNTVTPLHINIPMTANFVDMTRIVLEYDVKYWRAPVGGNAAVPLRPEDNAFPNANTGHTLIEQAELRVNGTNTGQTGGLYHFKPYLERTYNHTVEEKNTSLLLRRIMETRQGISMTRMLTMIRYPQQDFGMLTMLQVLLMILIKS
jgi:hypothetical protein